MASSDTAIVASMIEKPRSPGCVMPVESAIGEPGTRGPGAAIFLNNQRDTNAAGRERCRPLRSGLPRSSAEIAAHQMIGRTTCRRAPPSGDVPTDDAAVVRHDDLLDQREAEPGAVLLRREERLKIRSRAPERNAGTVVVDGDGARAALGVHGRAHDDSGRHRRVGARLDGVPQQVAERLPQQHLVSLDQRRTRRRRSTVAAERPGVGTRLVRHSLAQARADPRPTARAAPDARS